MELLWQAPLSFVVMLAVAFFLWAAVVVVLFGAAYIVGLSFTTARTAWARLVDGPGDHA